MLQAILSLHGAYFNPRSLTGATTVGGNCYADGMHFNPRSLTGATYGGMEYASAITFQSTLPHGSDYSGMIIVPIVAISIHAPSRERRALLSSLRRILSDFNPRSLTGATLSKIPILGEIFISIHAPSRERR